MTDIKKTSLALAALINAVRQCTANKEKGPLILDSIKRDGDLAELVSCLHKELKWDVSDALLEKCYERAGITPADTINATPQCEVLLEIYLDNDVYIHFALSHGEKGKVGDGVFMRSEAAREVMRRLRSMGVKINNIQIQ